MTQQIASATEKGIHFFTFVYFSHGGRRNGVNISSVSTNQIAPTQTQQILRLAATGATNFLLAAAREKILTAYDNTGTVLYTYAIH